MVERSDRMWSTGEGNGKPLQYSCHLYLMSSASVRSIPFLAERSYPTSEVRGSDQAEQPHFQGVVAAQAQEGLEELSHLEGQERRR